MRSFPRPLAPFSSFAVLAAAAHAADLHVPNQYLTIPLALSAAQPGDTIHVHGGVHFPIVISKAVTIVGDSGATIDNTSSSLVQPDNIKLGGHGFGNVVLIGLRLRGVANGYSQAWQGARVKGSGFDELHIQDCILDPPSWAFLTGVGQGACGIDVNVSHVLLTRSSVTGGGADTDGSQGIWPINGFAGVKNPGGAVTVLDSTVTGGNGMDGILFPWQIPQGTCPYNIPGPGYGGPGIEAKNIFESGSIVKGGMGSKIYEINTYKCQQPGGPAYVMMTLVSFSPTLTELGTTQIGSNWTLQWTSASSSVALLVTSGPVRPFYYPNVGWLFSDLSEIHVLEMVPGGAQIQSKVLTVPATLALVGYELVAQIWDPAGGLGNPIVRAVLP